MKKFNLTLTSFLLIFLCLTPALLAQEYKIITLKDGSIIKGKILSLTDNIYSVETTNFGMVRINDTDIVSIKAEGAQSTTNPALSSDQNNLNNLNPNQVKARVTQMQGQIMMDQGIMQDIMGLLEDPEVKTLLQDPELMNAIMSYDANKIEQNAKMQQLMQNPKIQLLINKISQKVTLPSN